jgi:hypothetical protein
MFSAVFLWMVAMTAYISVHKPLWQAGSEFSWARSPWAVATLFDAYFGFVTFFVWACFKERSFVAKAVWFVLIMWLGSIVMSGSVLIRRFRLKSDEPLSQLLRTVS